MEDFQDPVDPLVWVIQDLAVLLAHPVKPLAPKTGHLDAQGNQDNQDAQDPQDPQDLQDHQDHQDLLAHPEMMVNQVRMVLLVPLVPLVYLVRMVDQDIRVFLLPLLCLLHQHHQCAVVEHPLVNNNAPTHARSLLAIILQCNLRFQ